MPFERIRFSSFRNLADSEVDISSERIFLIGDNGQGKTNFLEALYYLSYGSSFRGSVDGDAIRYGENSFGLVAWTRSSDDSLLPPDEISVKCERGVKEIRRSGKRVSDRKELIEINPRHCILS